METKTQLRHFGRRAGWPLVLATFGALVLMGATAAPAQAGNFERGFEDQMGRILAYEAVNLGKHVLFQGVLNPHHGYRNDHRYSGHDGYRDGYNKGHDRHRDKHYRGHDRDRNHGKHYSKYDRGHGPSNDHWKWRNASNKHRGHKHRSHHNSSRRRHDDHRGCRHNAY